MEASHYTDKDFTNMKYIQERLLQTEALFRAEQGNLPLEIQRLIDHDDMLISTDSSCRRAHGERRVPRFDAKCMVGVTLPQATIL